MELSPETIEKIGTVGVLLLTGGGMIHWLLKDRARLVAALEEAANRERALRDQRTDDLIAQAKLMAEANQIVRDALTRVEIGLLELRKVITHETAEVEEHEKRRPRL